MMFASLESGAIEAALARLERWFVTVRGERGYHGPVVDVGSYGLGRTGPGFDWRYEGLLALHCARLKRGEATAQAALAADVEQIAAAQLCNGCFRASALADGPWEGGMPGEAAMLAAVCRAGEILDAAAPGSADDWHTVVDRYIQEYLCGRLWNKLLRTFNDLPYSDFERYRPVSVAAACDLLMVYGRWCGQPDRYASWLCEAGESLLAAQRTDGPCAGALPTAVPAGGRPAYSPWETARCVPVLARLGAWLDRGRCEAAATAAAAFVRRSGRPEGGFPPLVYAERPRRATPLMLGHTAGILRHLLGADRLDADAATPHLRLLLAEQMPTGAFATAIGFGRRQPRTDAPRDYRDRLPDCAWNAQVMALLVDLAGVSGAPAESTAPRLETVRGRGGVATLIEDDAHLEIADRRGRCLYLWQKQKEYPDTCLLP